MKYTARQMVDYLNPNGAPIVEREMRAVIACYVTLAHYFVKLNQTHFTVTYTIEIIPHVDAVYKYVQITATVEDVL